MTAHELTIALFWMVVAGYVTYLGWSIYSALRKSITRHHPRPGITDLADRHLAPVHPAIEAKEDGWFEVSDEDRLAG